MVVKKEQGEAEPVPASSLPPNEQPQQQQMQEEEAMQDQAEMEPVVTSSKEHLFTSEPPQPQPLPTPASTRPPSALPFSLPPRPESLLDLPEELIDLVAARLGPSDLAKLSMTCREVKAIADTHWVRIAEPGEGLAAPVPLRLSFSLGHRLFLGQGIKPRSPSTHIVDRCIADRIFVASGYTSVPQRLSPDPTRRDGRPLSLNQQCGETQAESAVQLPALLPNGTQTPVSHR